MSVARSVPTERADAVVIGAGVIGAAIALELARRGRSTVCVDALAGPSMGPTAGSCAIVRFHYSTADGVAMAYEGVRYWQGWADYLDAHVGELASYRACGTAALISRTGHHAKYLPHYRALGVPFEEWDADELARRLPHLDTREFWPPRRPEDEAFWTEPGAPLPGAIHTPESGYVNDPTLAGRNLADAAAALGARFRYRSVVTGILRDGARAGGVELADGARIEAPVVVNVAGPHSGRLNRLAGVEEGMRRRTRALRHEVHHVPAPAAWDLARDGIHVSDGDLGIYFRPDLGNAFLVGSEDPPCDPHEWVDDPDDFARAVTRAQWEAQVYRLARRVPGIGVPTTTVGFADLYDCSDDWIPIYDRSDLDGFYMAVGTSGNQFKNAGVAGACMAALIEACEAGHDHDAEPLTVPGRYTGLPLHLGMYSRLRAVEQGSSFSVMG